MKTKNKALNYAERVVNEEVVTPKYVKKQSQEFLNIWNGLDPKYCINEKTADLINKLLKMLQKDFPSGPVAKTLHSQCTGLGFNPWSKN